MTALKKIKPEWLVALGILAFAAYIGALSPYMGT